jgi:uncharacterized protein
MDYSSLIAQNSEYAHKEINAVVNLLKDGATIPFIARYRKEMTGSLDEVAIGDIKDAYDRFLALAKRKEFILKTIQEQGSLTPELKAKINACWDEILLEDYYLPFKKKVKTRGTQAKEKGLEPLAQFIFELKSGDILAEAKKYISDKVPTQDNALQGARDIVAEWISESSVSREIVRKTFNSSAVITSKVVKKKIKEAEKFKDYFDFSERLKKCPSHRILAMNRGESEKFLRVKLEIDEEAALYHLKRNWLKGYSDAAEQMKLSIADGYKRLLFPSLESEFRKLAKEKSDDEAIAIFSVNLKQLLLAAPLGSKTVLALDPGFRTGCKLVVLSKQSDLLEYKTIFPHPPQSKWQESLDIIDELSRKHKVEAIAVGNGTAGKETMQLLKKYTSSAGIELYLINESGASIYSASKIAREEFPDHDITVRGAVSIGRRLMDPLAELVKIDPKSIGVGQYQHDVNQPKLKKQLEAVVENCVNQVGINLNTSSQHLLNHIAGLGPTLSSNIVNYRTEYGAFKSRKTLLKVPRMGAKAYEQAAGFLRVRESTNPLDNTGIHPESYTLVKKMASSIGKSVELLMGNKQLLSEIRLADFISDKVGMPTLKDIIAELEKPGVDPRGSSKTVQFDDHINTINDLKEGQILTGVVNNITKFGAFVDIGIKESGLVHISQITNRFIKSPEEVLSLNQEVKVKVMEVDVSRKRISLSIKAV